jgi:hypothetical protein
MKKVFLSAVLWSASLLHAEGSNAEKADKNFYSQAKVIFENSKKPRPNKPSPCDLLMSGEQKTDDEDVQHFMEFSRHRCNSVNSVGEEKAGNLPQEKLDGLQNKTIEDRVIKCEVWPKFIDHILKIKKIENNNYYALAKEIIEAMRACQNEADTLISGEQETDDEELKEFMKTSRVRYKSACEYKAEEVVKLLEKKATEQALNEAKKNN